MNQLCQIYTLWIQAVRNKFHMSLCDDLQIDFLYTVPNYMCYQLDSIMPGSLIQI